MEARAAPLAATDAWRRGLADLPREHGFEPLDIEGQIPDELRGVLYRAGPAIFGRFGRRYGHPFDGDGAVSAVRFERGRAAGAVRVIETDAWRRETRQARALFGGWGTAVPGLMRGFQAAAKNPANTAVLPYRRQLFALYEGGLPTEILPESLATVGPYDFDGAILASFSAHPRYCPARDAFYNFGVRYGVVSFLDVYTWSATAPMRRVCSIPLPYAPIIHDFGVAGDDLLFLVPPVRINLYTAAFGRRAMSESFSWRPSRGLEVLLVPLDAPERLTRFRTDPFQLWHFVDAWTDGGQVRADVIAYPDFATNDWFAGLLRPGPNPPAEASLVRLTIDRARRRVACERLSADSCEFPVVAPAVRGRPHRYAYLVQHSSREAARGWWDQLAKHDFASGGRRIFPLPAGHYPSEALFIPRERPQSEDDGFLVALVLDPTTVRTRAVVWSAAEPERPPLGEARFAHAIPFTFHGCWRRAR